MEKPWHDFYILMGTAAATLMGLIFVIVSLGPHVIRGRIETTVRAFVSPTAIYFGTVLVVSAVMLAPDLGALPLGALLTIDGVGSLIYIAWTGVHQRWREIDLPFMDWIWNVGLPVACFILVVASGTMIATEHPLGLQGIAATMLLLIVVGIRNAWDVVLWIAEQSREGRKARATKPTDRDAPR